MRDVVNALSGNLLSSKMDNDIYKTFTCLTDFRGESASVIFASIPHTTIARSREERARAPFLSRNVGVNHLIWGVLSAWKITLGRISHFRSEKKRYGGEWCGRIAGRVILGLEKCLSLGSAARQQKSLRRKINFQLFLSLI